MYQVTTGCEATTTPPRTRLPPRTPGSAGGGGNSSGLRRSPSLRRQQQKVAPASVPRSHKKKLLPHLPSSASRSNTAATATAAGSSGKTTTGASTNTIHATFRSALRIRPFSENEQHDEEEELVLLTPDDGVVVSQRRRGGGCVEEEEGGDASAAAVAILKAPSATNKAAGGRIRSPLRRKSQRSRVAANATTSRGVREKDAIFSPPSTGRKNHPSDGGEDLDDDAAAAEEVGDAKRIRFDAVLNSNASQRQTYETIGLPMALDVMVPLQMNDHFASSAASAAAAAASGHDGSGSGGGNEGNSKNHVLVSLGISNSGKTHTIFGDCATKGDSYCVIGGGEHVSSSRGGRRGHNNDNHDRRGHNHRDRGNGDDEGGDEEGEGIVPRLIDELFTTYEWDARSFKNKSSATAATSTSFAVRMSMMHVHNDKVYDMLSTTNASPSSSGNSEGNNSGSAGANGSAPSSRQRRVSSVKQRVASLERLRGVGGGGGGASSAGAAATNDESDSMKEIRIRHHQDPHHQHHPGGGGGNGGTGGCFSVEPTIVTYTTSAETRSALRKGLDRVKTRSTGLNASSSRGHTIVVLRPVVIEKKRRSRGNTDSRYFRSSGTEENEEVEEEIVVQAVGGTISILDLAGIERTKKSRVSGFALKESVSINSSIFGVLSCLRAIQENGSLRSSTAAMSTAADYDDDEEENDPAEGNHQQRHPHRWKNRPRTPSVLSRSKSKRGGDLHNGKASNNKVVPYRQSKLTMLLQPLLSGVMMADAKDEVSDDSIINSEGTMTHRKDVETIVTLLVSAYPGRRDYAEKKSLFVEVESLRGLTVTDTTAAGSTLSSKTIVAGRNTPNEEVEEDEEDAAAGDLSEVDEDDEVVSPSGHRGGGTVMSPPIHPSFPIGGSATKFYSPSFPPTRSSSPIATAAATAPPYDPPFHNKEGTPSSNSKWMKRSPLKRISTAVASAATATAKSHHGSKRKKEPVAPPPPTPPSRDDDDQAAEVNEGAAGECYNSYDREETERVAKKMRKLEDDNAALSRRNDRYREQCDELRRDNENLAKLLETAQEELRAERQRSKRRAAAAAAGGDDDDSMSDEREHRRREEFEQAREVRIEQQNLLKRELRDHMNVVKETSEANQFGFPSRRKEPFPLNVPLTWNGGRYDSANVNGGRKQDEQDGKLQVELLQSLARSGTRRNVTVAPNTDGGVEVSIDNSRTEGNQEDERHVRALRSLARTGTRRNVNLPHRK